MKLAIVILNWNACEDTQRCIRSVSSWEGGLGLPRPTIWVVDNGSREGCSKAAIENFSQVHLLRSAFNRGFAGGNNLAIKAALEDGADTVLLLNNDAVVSEESVVSMAETLLSDARIGIVGPTLWDGDVLLSVGGRDIALHSTSHLRPDRVPTHPLDVDYVSGTVALLAKDVFQAVGLLDEDYFFGGEMADLCHRARGVGFRCVTDPRARAFHDLERSIRLRDTLHAYYVFRNRFLFARKHYPSKKVRLYGLWTLRGVREVLSAVARGRLGRARAVGLGVLDGLAGRFGGQNERLLHHA